MGTDRNEILQTTLGDLILALTEEVAQVVEDKKQAAELVAFILTDLLYDSAPISKSWH